jgi:hypothetical protein
MHIINLILIFVSLFLVSCSHSPATKKDTTPESQQYAEAAKKARERGPMEGDVRVVDGVELVYGRNVKYMSTPGEPVYVWVRRDLYAPSLLDTMPGHVGSPTNNKELSELEERLAKLERAMRGESAPQTAHPEQPVKDATGRTWTRYFRNDDGVEWFLDQGAPLQPSRDAIQMWRKRVFPSWAFQKEIVTLDDLDCREARYRMRELRVAYWDGKTQTSDKVTPWAKVFSGSPEEYLMNEYCK